MPTSAPSTAPSSDPTTSSPPGTPANPSVSLGTGTARAGAATRTSVTFGQRCSESFATYARDSCSWRTCAGTLPWGSDEFSETWPKAGMTRSGRAYRLPISVRHTSESAYSFWPTPTTSDYKGATTAEASKAWEHRGTNLPEAVQLAAIGDCRWPPPPGTLIAFEDDDTPLVICEACLEPHPGAWNGPLNPAWVEWLMGFPIGWTDLEPSETQSSQPLPSSSAKDSDENA